MNIETKPMPDYGDVMTLEEFIDCCKCGLFIDYDGSGYYAESPQTRTNLLCSPSDIMRGDIKDEYTHVIWFNK